MYRGLWGQRKCNISLKEENNMWLVKVKFESSLDQQGASYLVAWRVVKRRATVPGLPEIEEHVRLNPPVLAVQEVNNIPTVAALKSFHSPHHGLQSEQSRCNG